MSGSNIRKLLRKAMESEWAVAYRKKRDGEILNSEIQDFSIINNTLRYWCADPFVVEDGTKTYLFFEAFDRLKRKGMIGYREISNRGLGKINIAIEEPYHLSYPYVYNEGGRWYIIPESKDANRILRYQSKKFPDAWEREQILIEPISAVDTTIFHSDRVDLKLFTYLFEAYNKGALQIIRLKDHTPITLCKIEDLDGRKRPAGKICRIGSADYRPSQLCTLRYGEAIIFNKILSGLTDDSYEETEYMILRVSDISLNRNVMISGVHTYNSSENWEVIDVELIGFSIVRFLGLIPRIYHHIKRTKMNSGSDIKLTER